LVDGPPEVLTLAADRHEEFVQMPRVAHWPRPSPEPSRVGRTEGLHQCRMDSYDTVIPRWARRSSTSRKRRVNR
jgi:hypothetical protein